MAGIVNGIWRDSHSINPRDADPINNWITVDGSPGPTGRGGFQADAGRYHVYLAHGCPFCHGVTIARRYLEQEPLISVSYVDDVKRHEGWPISGGADPVFDASSLHEMMICAEGKITSKSTVPQLIDRKTKRLVSDSSSDMVRMMDQLGIAEHGPAGSLWPSDQEADILELSEWIKSTISGGIYRTLFAQRPEDKQQHRQTVKNAFAEIDARLHHSRFLHGEAISASDVWLFPTLIRFNSIYAEIFGLDFKLETFENLGPYLRDLWSIDAFAGTSNLKRIEDHYYLSFIHGPHGPIEPGLGKSADKTMRYDLSRPDERSSKVF